MAVAVGNLCFSYLVSASSMCLVGEALIYTMLKCFFFLDHPSWHASPCNLLSRRVGRSRSQTGALICWAALLSLSTWPRGHWGNCSSADLSLGPHAQWSTLKCCSLSRTVNGVWFLLAEEITVCGSLQLCPNDVSLDRPR